MTIPAEQWASAWREHESTTIQQAALAEADLERWLAGAPHASFDPFRKLLEPILPYFRTLLEIGSGWGGYCKVLEHIDATKLYYGCDISKHMIEHAKQTYRGYKFKVCDSESLSYGDKEMDVVCISGLIQHLADCRPSIREATRVSKRYVLLHRCECTNAPSHEFIRKAYDSEIPTRRINRGELQDAWVGCGLKMIAEETWSISPSQWNASMLLERA